MRKFIWECVRSIAHTLSGPAQAFAQLADRHCEECIKPMVPLDGVDMCVKCGDLKVQPSPVAWSCIHCQSSPTGACAGHILVLNSGDIDKVGQELAVRAEETVRLADANLQNMFWSGTSVPRQSNLLVPETKIQTKEDK